MPNFVPSAATEGRPAQKKKWCKKWGGKKMGDKKMALLI
jgi:hypothetical protein